MPTQKMSSINAHALLLTAGIVGGIMWTSELPQTQLLPTSASGIGVRG